MLSRHSTLKGALAAASLTLFSAGAYAEMPAMQLDGDVEAGKAVAMDRAKGNCIACHVIPGGDSPGAIGPALVAIQTRFPSKEEVARQIWDPTVKNPEVVMPPFGKHGILSNQDFVNVVEYIWSL
ncbi:sulfur oxidation c-type cytochrome SoxX [Thiohalocapsa marina]|uniref:Sulfur oxidation c-type cytochrome SoxX n=1 Tax=Thiohalocapsa marina TaxID=424902 RepID=A0A5M8FII9_9GAMM|nr:sulfur oxidation c-type cytochrome SoxX [Thiohalocapsa marina]KAA6183800.1 sulfur oxidation c-type cytochrome SoxX [Thiohalocapsa marina]